MANTDDMIHVTQSEFEQLVRKDAGCIRKPEQTVIRKDRSEPHGPSM
jgi:hypothetical protein